MRSNQSILKEINPEYSLEGQMLKLQYSGHLIRRANSSEKTLTLGKTRAGEGGSRGRNGWMAPLTQWTWVWANLGRWWRKGKPGVLQSMESQRGRQDWVTEQKHRHHYAGRVNSRLAEIQVAATVWFSSLKRPEGSSSGSKTTGPDVTHTTHTTQISVLLWKRQLFSCPSADLRPLWPVLACKTEAVAAALATHLVSSQVVSSIKAKSFQLLNESMST